MIYRHCRSTQNMMIHHHLTGWKWPFSESNTTIQPFLTTSTTDNIRSTDGVLIMNNELILARFTDCLQNLLSKVHITNMDFQYDLLTLQIIAKIDDPSSFEEVEKAIFCLKENKQPVLTTSPPDNILTKSVVLLAY